MVDLVPAPNSLGLTSPALGPWFAHTDSAVALPTLAMPNADLSVSVSLADDLEWRAPAACFRSFIFADATRPPALAGLRQENGTPAFADGSLIILLTLLPDVEARLWGLTSILPSPESTDFPVAADVNETTGPRRPRIRHLALEIPTGQVTDMDTIESFLAADFSSELDDADKKAKFLGLSAPRSNGRNAKADPISDFLRPSGDLKTAFKNRTGGNLSARLWAFDFIGRPLDPGAVANWWTHMVTTGQWDNLWVDDDETNPVSCAVASGRSVHIVNPHEGALESDLKARLDLTDLTIVAGANTYYTAGSSPAIAMTTAPDPDTAPIPRIAALPFGDYAAPDSATPFAGWTDSSWPSDISRDFLRIGFLDMERFLIGLDRSDTAQADEKTRRTAFRNIAATPFLMTVDDVNREMMTVLAAGASAIAMSPVIDRLWGEVIPPSDFGTGELPSSLEYTVRGLAGDGTDVGNTSENQSVVITFETTIIDSDTGETWEAPPNAWIRAWPHGLDTQSGLRFRQTGGAARIDASGTAHLVMPIPDGASAAADARLSFDALIVTDTESRHYFNQSYDRPAIIAGNRESLPGGGGGVANASLWVCETGTNLTRGASEYQSGQTLLVVPNDPAADNFRLVDLASLEAADIADATVLKAATANDTLIATEPAFAQTGDGDVTAAIGTETFVRRDRTVVEAINFGRPLVSQERRELVALERDTNTAVIGGHPGRANLHEAPPIQLGHPGVPAASETHAPGISLAGPITDPLVDLMIERQSPGFDDYWTNASQPFTAVADPGGTTSWATILETTSRGMAGGGVISGYITDNPGWTPGETYLGYKADLQTWLDNNLPAAAQFDLDDRIDSATFDDDTLARRTDAMVGKTKDGARDFATSFLAAIGRAEDFIYIETPALDMETGQGTDIDIVGALKTRLAARPGLSLLLCLSDDMEASGQEDVILRRVRRHGIKKAVAELKKVAKAQVVAFYPKAGPGRASRIMTTTVIVDDAIMLSGSTHLWRRGLTFDTSLAVALFDENVVNGRPEAVQNARRQLMANMLGLDIALVPLDPTDCREALLRLSEGGGLARSDGRALTRRLGSDNSGEAPIWNPDGRNPNGGNWGLFIAALTGQSATDFNNAIR